MINNIKRLTIVGGNAGGSGTTDYNLLENKPAINGVTLEGDLELDIPTKLSELTNDIDWWGTQEQYDALEEIDPNIRYHIEGNGEGGDGNVKVYNIAFNDWFNFDSEHYMQPEDRKAYFDELFETYKKGVDVEINYMRYAYDWEAEEVIQAIENVISYTISPSSKNLSVSTTIDNNTAIYIVVFDTEENTYRLMVEGVEGYVKERQVTAIPLCFVDESSRFNSGNRIWNDKLEFGKRKLIITNRWINDIINEVWDYGFNYNYEEVIKYSIEPYGENGGYSCVFETESKIYTFKQADYEGTIEFTETEKQQGGGSDKEIMEVSYSMGKITFADGDIEKLKANPNDYDVAFTFNGTRVICSFTQSPAEQIYAFDGLCNDYTNGIYFINFFLTPSPSSSVFLNLTEVPKEVPSKTKTMTYEYEDGSTEEINFYIQ